MLVLFAFFPGGKQHGKHLYKCFLIFRSLTAVQHLLHLGEGPLYNLHYHQRSDELIKL